MSPQLGRLTRHTQKLVDAVLTAWRAGASYTEMGKSFGIGKNTIAGLVARNKRTGEVAKRSFRPRGWAPADVPLKRLPQTQDTGGKMPMGRAAIHTEMEPVGKEKTCQWIAGDPSSDDKCKCGADTGDSNLYCPNHEERAWIRVQHPQD